MKKRKQEDKKKRKLSPDSVWNDITFYTPKRFNDIMANYEIKHTKKQVIIVYAGCIALAVLFSIVFKLQPSYWIFTIMSGVFFAPIIVIEMIREKNEYKKFNDINSYSQQFISGMQLNHKILFALENTLYTFPSGRMNQTLENALTYIQRSTNPQQAQVEALVYIDTMYPNPQTPMIHDFAQRIERTGGNFEQEMDLLNTKREKWEKRVEHEQKQTQKTMIGAVILYIAMIIICLIIANAMPPDLSVYDFSFVQVAETIVISATFPFIYACCRQVRKGWLRGEIMMQDEEAEYYLDYIENYDGKKEGKKGIICGSVLILITIVAHLLLKNIYLTFILLAGSVAGFNIHNIQYSVTLNKVKKEISRAMPRWLFDVGLCLQKQSVVASVESSLKTAPPILKRDIDRFLAELKIDASDITPYLKFLEFYQILSINSTMRALLAIQNGTGGNKSLQMRQLIEHNLNLLDDQDATEEEIRRLSNVKFTTLSSIPATGLMFVYFVAIIIKVFDSMTNMI